MSNMLKCPHPTCPYVFDPAQVPAGVVLSCPRCGMQFTLGPPVPPPAHAHTPGYAPAPGYPPAGYGAAPPPAPPIEPEFEDVGRTAVEERDPYAPRPGRRTSQLQMFILAGLAAVLMAGTALIIIFVVLRRDRTTSVDTATVLSDRNISVDTPPSGWTRDDKMKVDLGSPYILSFKRENPEAHVAFGANESKTKGRAPRPSEMRENLMGTFSKLFDKDNFTELPPAETKWLGETVGPNHGFKFRAQSTDGLVWVGDAYTVAYKGIAYYWMSWCGENDYESLKGEFAAFREKFKLLQVRKDWTETATNVTDYKGDKVPYIISDAEELWKEVSADEYPGLKAAEPDLDRRLRMSRAQRGRKDRQDTAELSVYILDATGDPLEVARKYTEEKEVARIKAANAEFAPKITELTDPAKGDPVPTTVPSVTPYVRLKSQVAEASGQARLFVVSGLKVGDKIVVVLCSCELTKRDPFETKFVQIASSLR